jgi:AraC-like DNA-binding protein
MENVPYFKIDGPLLALPPQGSIRSDHYLGGFKSYVQLIGKDYREIFDEYDIDPVAIDNPDYPLNGSTGIEILDYCARRFDDSQFGLHLAEHQDPEIFGCLAMLARSAPTLRAAVESIVEYLPVLHHPGTRVELLTASQTAELRFEPSQRSISGEQVISHGLHISLKLIRSLGVPDFRPQYVNALAHPPPKTVAFMEGKFGCKIHTGASANTIAFNVAYLDRPLRSANRHVYGLLRSYASKLKHASEPTLVSRIERYIQDELFTGKCSLESCADAMGMSSRTLHRHLSERGLSFSDLLEQQRAAMAKAALLEHSYTLDEIAFSLGYSDKSSFARAFKRWTNTTPGAFREIHRGAAEG